MKIALITGANKGIGLASARQLGQSGAKVLIGARDPTKGEQAAGELRDEQIDAEALTLDVTDQVSVLAAASQVEQEHGRLDILVNNAGILPEATDTDQAHRPLDPRMFRDTFETNVFGVVSVTQAFLPLLERSGGGRIVNGVQPDGVLGRPGRPRIPVVRPRCPRLPGDQGGAELDHDRAVEEPGGNRHQGQRDLPRLRADRPWRTGEQGSRAANPGRSRGS